MAARFGVHFLVKKIAESSDLKSICEFLPCETINMKLCKFIFGVNKHATNDTVRGKLGKLSLKIMQRRINFYSRANSLGENDLMMHACNSNGLWCSLLDKITGKYQVTAEHHTFGSPTDSAHILNNMMTTYESLWY